MRYDFERTKVLGDADAKAVTDACEGMMLKILEPDFFGLKLDGCVLGQQNLATFRERLAGTTGRRSSQFTQMLSDLAGCESVMVVASPKTVVVYGSQYELDMGGGWEALNSLLGDAKWFDVKTSKFSDPHFTVAATQ